MSQPILLLLAAAIGYIVASLSILPIGIGFVLCSVICHTFPQAHQRLDQMFAALRLFARSAQHQDGVEG